MLLGVIYLINSMTGFGRSELTENNLHIITEIKSVNHRYFEWNARLPRSCAFLEDKLKAYCQSKIARGKVEMYVSVEFLNGDATEVSINEEYANSYIAALKSLAEKYALTDDITVTTVARNPEVFCEIKREIDEEAVTQSVLKATEVALQGFISMRQTEGERLKADIENRIDFITKKVEYIDERSPETVKLYRERLEQKIRELLESAQVDEQRLLTETAIFADKVAVAEETVRLKSHMQQMSSMLESGTAVGRKLDFIVQEMNREANTIGSKCQDALITGCVLDIKSEIEKIREQVQNIE